MLVEAEIAIFSAKDEKLVCEYEYELNLMHLSLVCPRIGGGGGWAIQGN